MDARGGHSLEHSSASLSLEGGEGKKSSVGERVWKRNRSPLTQEELLEAEVLFSNGWKLTPRLSRVLQDLLRRCEACILRWELMVAGLLEYQTVHTKIELARDRLGVALTAGRKSRWALLVTEMVENQLALRRFELAKKRMELALFKERQAEWNRMACSICFGRWLMAHCQD